MKWGDKRVNALARIIRASGRPETAAEPELVKVGHKDDLARLAHYAGVTPDWLDGLLTPDPVIRRKGRAARRHHQPKIESTLGRLGWTLEDFLDFADHGKLPTNQAALFHDFAIGA